MVEAAVWADSPVFEMNRGDSSGSLIKYMAARTGVDQGTDHRSAL